MWYGCFVDAADADSVCGESVYLVCKLRVRAVCYMYVMKFVGDRESDLRGAFTFYRWNLSDDFFAGFCDRISVFFLDWWTVTIRQKIKNIY